MNYLFLKIKNKYILNDKMQLKKGKNAPVNLASPAIAPNPRTQIMHIMRRVVRKLRAV